MMADYGYPGTWYIAVDGRKRRCRTIGGSPCHQHANGGSHITDDAGNVIIASNETELEAKLHAGLKTGMTGDAHMKTNDDMMETQASDKINKPAVKPHEPVIPMPGMMMNSSLKKNIMMKQARERKREQIKSERAKPETSIDDRIKIRNGLADELKKHGSWIYDSNVFKGYTDKTTSQLAHELYPDAVEGDAAENPLTRAARNIHHKLDSRTQFAVKDYTEVGYRQVNADLRDGNEMDARSHELMTGMDRAIHANAPLEHDTVLYRTIELNDMTTANRGIEEKRAYDAIASGDGIVDNPAYISTSFKGSLFAAGEHENTEIIILAKAGTRGIAITDSQYDEHEYVIDRGTCMRVKAIYETGDYRDADNWRLKHPVIIMETIPE